MQELLVKLDFGCLACREPVVVTVKCVGEGLGHSQGLLANVQVPCPTCGKIHHLVFEPSGTVRAVHPGPAWRYPVRPSSN